MIAESLVYTLFTKILIYSVPALTSSALFEWSQTFSSHAALTSKLFFFRS